jgi:hypothetical protein
MAAPNDRLMTWAPLSAAHMTPSATSAGFAPSSAPKARTAMILAFGATPAMPLRLLVTAAAAPATAVPCPCRSAASKSSLIASYCLAGRKLPFRSSWVLSTPVSTMAMVMPAPCAVFHAVGAPIRRRPHCCLKYGSLGAVAATAGVGQLVATAIRASTRPQPIVLTHLKFNASPRSGSR